MKDRRRDDAEPGQDEGDESEVMVSRIAVARDVQDREPVDEGSSLFPPDSGHLVCFTRIENAGEADSVFHVWSYDDEEMARVELQVKGPPWRTWSKKTILRSHVGEWRVTIESSTGKVLASTTFAIDGAGEGV